MPNQFDFVKGIYRVLVPRLRIRTTKVAQVTTNYAKDEQGNEMKFTQGMKVPVYDVEFNPQGWVWESPLSDNGNDESLESRVLSLEARVTALEKGKA